MRHLVKKQLTLLGILLLVIALSGCGFIDRLKARDHLNEGVRDYTAKRYDDAIVHFRDAVQLDPQLIDAYLYMAITYRAQYVPQATNAENLDKAQKAIETFEEVLRRAGDNKNVKATAMANIAGIYSGLGEYNEAKEWYRQRLELEPNNPEPLYGIGTINWQLSYDVTGMDGENVKDLDDAKKQEMNQLVDEGMDVLKKALQINPKYVEAMQYLNLMYREKAKLTDDQEQKRQWLRQADRLALESLELTRKIQEEEERARRQLLTGKKQE